MVVRLGLRPSNNNVVVVPPVTPPGQALDKRIFVATPSAWPGQAINLTGSFSTTAKFYLKTPTKAAVQVLPASNGTITNLVENNVTLRIPTSAGFDQYEVYVVDNNVQYASVFINQAEVWGMNTDEVCQEGTVEMTGQNLQVFPGLAKVQLQKAGSSSKVDMIMRVANSTEDRVRFTLPSGMALGTYDVFFYNGFGSAVPANKSIKVIAKGNDSYGLGSRVPVAGKFTNFTTYYDAVTRQNNQGDVVLPVGLPTNGTSDSFAALKQQLAWLKANGGGRLVLPGGMTFKGSSDNELVIPSNVVLWTPKDNPATIRVEGNAPNDRYVFIWENGSQLNGMMYLRFQNVCTISNTLAWRNMVGENGKDRFVVGCSFNLSESEWLQDLHCTRLYWLDNYIQQGINRQSRPRQRGYGRFEETQYGVFDNNTVDFAVEGINFHGSKNTYHSNNKLTWNGTLGNREEIVNHFTVWGNSEDCCCYNDYLTVDDNYQSIKDMEILKFVGKPTNDGESYIAEETGGEAVFSFGSLVTSATVKSITYPNLPLQPSDNYHVRIISGKGMGQTRKVKTYSSTQLTVTEDFDVAPDSSSHFSIFVFNLRRFLLQGIKLKNVKRGPTLYWAHIDRCTVANFDMVNSGAIDFTPRQNYVDGRVKWNGQWGIVIKNNVSNVADDTFNGSFMGMHMVLDNSNAVFGVGGLGLVVRNNKITARNPNVRCRVDNNYLNSFMADCEWHPDGRNFGGTIPAILGAIFEDNEGVNCTSTFDTSRAVHNTYVRNMIHTGRKLTLADIRNDQGDGFAIHNDFLGGGSGTTNLLILTDTIAAPSAPIAPTTSFNYAPQTLAQYVQPTSGWVDTTVAGPAWEGGPTVQIQDGKGKLFLFDNLGKTRIIEDRIFADFNRLDGAFVAYTNDPVIFRRCKFIGNSYSGLLLASNSPGGVTIEDCEFYGLVPPSTADSGDFGTKGIHLVQNVSSATIRRNYVTNCYGMMLQGLNNQAGKFLIEDNFVYNASSRRKDGSKAVRGNGIQIFECQNIDCEVRWNLVFGVPGQADNQDLYNIHSSTGKSYSQAIFLHHNLGDGSYGFPLPAYGFTGSGMTTDGDYGGPNGTARRSGFVRFEDNRLINCGNAGVNIAGGNDIYAYRNLLYSNQLTADGQLIGNIEGAMAAFNYLNLGLVNVVVENNTLAYVRQDGTPRPNGDGSIIDVSKNTVLTSVTEAAKRKVYTDWMALRAQNGYPVR